MVHDEHPSGASRRAAQAMAVAAPRAGLALIALQVPAMLKVNPMLNDLRRSDHAPFWGANYAALMITDTANFRNARYHCGADSDAVDSLDHGVAAAVIEATVASAQVTRAVTQRRSRVAPPTGQVAGARAAEGGAPPRPRSWRGAGRVRRPVSDDRLLGADAATSATTGLRQRLLLALARGEPAGDEAVGHLAGEGRGAEIGVEQVSATEVEHRVERELRGRRPLGDRLRVGR